MADEASASAGTAREVALGVAAVTVLMGVGTVGYVAIEGWRAMDALYMTFLTLTTIGFNEVAPLSDAGRIFTMALASVGIATFAFNATRVVQLVVTNTAFRQRAMHRRIDHLSGHYVIAGYGRLGQRIARDLVASGRDVVVIDRRDDRVEDLLADGLLHVQGEATEEATLRATGLDRAEGLVLVLPADASNVFVALTALEIAEGRNLFFLTRTNEDGSVNKLLRAGADKVVSPLEIGADRIAQTILRPRVDRFMEKVLGVGTLDFDLEEVVIARGSLLDGRSLADVDFRQRFEAVVIGVLRDDGSWHFNPAGDVILHAGDTLIVLAATEPLAHLRAEGAAA